MNRHSVDISRSFDSYLHTIARNSAINFLKHKYVEDTYLSSVQQQECSSTSEEDLIAKELGLLIDDTVEKNAGTTEKDIHAKSQRGPKQ